MCKGMFVHLSGCLNESIEWRVQVTGNCFIACCFVILKACIFVFYSCHNVWGKIRFSSQNLCTYLLLFIVSLYILCKCYAISKLYNRLYKF